MSTKNGLSAVRLDICTKGICPQQKIIVILPGPSRAFLRQFLYRIFADAAGSFLAIRGIL